MFFQRVKTVFRALGGSDTFHWGAGMWRISNAAAFIKANMPLGLPGTLTNQQAWDVAQYMNSHERPQVHGQRTGHTRRFPRYRGFDVWPRGRRQSARRQRRAETFRATFS